MVGTYGVEVIKDRARSIAELSEEEFTSLCTEARTFSLAQPFVTMTDPSEALASITSSYAGRPTLESLNRTSRHFRDSADCKIDMPILEGEDRITDSDSGVFNASKTASCSTTTCIENSDSDPNEEMEERVGVFDYVQSPSRKKTTSDKGSSITSCSTSSFHSDIDRSYSADHNWNDDSRGNTRAYSDSINKGFNKASDSDVIHNFRSHKTDIFERNSSWTEMRNLSEINAAERHKNNQRYDEAVNADTDGDDNLENVNVHESMYSHRNERYASMEAEDEEDYDSDPKHSSRTSLLSSRNHIQKKDKITFHDPRGYGAVDATINFSLGNSKTRSLEEGGGSYPSCRSPPFGSGPSLRQVGDSVSRLVDTQGGRSQSIPGMPAGAPISDRESQNDELGKKKKRKKKRDDSRGDNIHGFNSKDAAKDVNGNPIEVRQKMGAKLTAGGGSRTLDNPASSGRSKAFPEQLSDYGTYSLNGVSVADHEEKKEYVQKQQRKNKRKEKKEGKMVKAEDIPGYRGTDRVDDLLDFIENNAQGGKKGKRKGHVPNGLPFPTTSTPTMIPVDKNARRSKERRLKGLLSGRDDRTGSENSSERGDDGSSKASDLYMEASEVLGSSIDLSSKDSNKDSFSSLDRISNSSGKAEGSSWSNNNMLPDNYYIFTDLDVGPPVEEEFTVVTSKKKKQHKDTKEVPHREPSGVETKREPRQRIQRGRSVTPPPGAGSRIEKSTDRAFSPSSFPVLGAREGRRNSTGNAPSEANLEVEDSDLESVKSLPLVTPSAGGENKSISSGMQNVVSYAKIAAAPKPQGVPGFPVDSKYAQNAPSAGSVLSDDGTSDSTQRDTHSKTTEDNKSSSSSPEPEMSDNFSKEAGSPQDVSANAAPQEGISPAPHPPVANVLVPETFDQEYPALGSEMPTAAEPPSSLPCDPVVEFSIADAQVSVGPDQSTCDVDIKPTAQGSDPTLSPASSKDSEQAQPNDDISSSSCSAAGNLAPPCTGQVPQTSVKVHTNNSKKTKGKSVVFLDGKFNDAPRNLDISFGFEPSLEESTPPCSGTGSAPSSSSDNQDKSLDKLQQIVASKNGLTLIPISKPVENNRPSVTVHNPGVKGHNEISTATSAMDVPISIPSPDINVKLGATQINTQTVQGVKVDIGETDKVSDTDNKLELTPKVDYNMERGRFNLEEAITYLIREWDRVMELKEKSDNRVIYYQSSK